VRLYASWGAGITAALALHTVGTRLLAELGIPVWIDFATPRQISYGRGDESEIDGATTAPGWCLLALSITVGAWIGRSLFVGSMLRPFDIPQRAQWLGWFVGSTVALISTTLLWIVLPPGRGFAEALFSVLEIGLVAASVFIGVRLARSQSRDQQPSSR
jgi:hypothetical protein